MRRREFITLLGGAAVSWPLAVRAQQPDRIRLIGVLMGFAENDPTAQSMVAAFRAALAKLGWTEGSNVRMNCTEFKPLTPPKPKILPVKVLPVPPRSSPPLPLGRKLTFSPPEPAISTMPLLITALPPLTTAPLAISTSLPAPSANSAPEFLMVPLSVSVSLSSNIKDDHPRPTGDAHA
jgi:hypothetical protein